MSTVDSKFKLKSIKKSILQRKLKKDTVQYNSEHFSCLFTDYTYKENIFLPQKIIYLTNTLSKDKRETNTINIEYKSVKFFRDKNE